MLFYFCKIYQNEYSLSYKKRTYVSLKRNKNLFNRTVFKGALYALFIITHAYFDIAERI